MVLAFFCYVSVLASLAEISSNSLINKKFDAVIYGQFPLKFELLHMKENNKLGKTMDR